MALLMSMTAMSIDIMLPALPEIGASLGVRDTSQLPLVVTVFMLGMAIGQLVWGPLADRFGRRRPLLLGLALFVLATTVAVTTQSFSQLLAARFLQGIGGSVGRIIVTAIVRDLFVGRQMARVMSMVMMVFILVPMLAPSVGQLIILVGTWRWLFAVLLAASLTSLIWASSRLPETQPPLAAGARRLTVGEALVLVLSNRVTFGYGIASGFVLGLLVAYIASAQQVFGTGYGLGKLFPFAFGSVACAIALASFTNSRLVRRLGMRRLSHTALVAHLGLSAALGAARRHRPPAALAGARRHGRLLLPLRPDPVQLQCHRHAADGAGRRHGGIIDRQLFDSGGGPVRNTDRRASSTVRSFRFSPDLRCSGSVLCCRSSWWRAGLACSAASEAIGGLATPNSAPRQRQVIFVCA